MPNHPLKTTDPEIISVAEKHGCAPTAVLEVLTELQERRGGTSKDTLTDVANVLKMPASKVYGIATFYSMLSTEEQKRNIIRVCDGPVCWLKRAGELRGTIDSLMKDHPDWKVERTSCLGLCDRAPAVLVNEHQAGPILPEQAEKILDGWHGEATDYSKPRAGELRVMMAKAGIVDPDSIKSALEHGAYCGLKKALQQPSESVLAEVETSGLTGRGGAGFPVGRKWRFVYQAKGNPKYIICKDRKSVV